MADDEQVDTEMPEIVDNTPEDTLAAEILLEMAADYEDTEAAELLIQLTADYLMGTTPVLEGQDDVAMDGSDYDGGDEESSETSGSPQISPRTMQAEINAMPIHHPKRWMVKDGKMVEWKIYPKHDYAVRDDTATSESKPDSETSEYKPSEGTPPSSDS